MHISQNFHSVLHCRNTKTLIGCVKKVISRPEVAIVNKGYMHSRCTIDAAIRDFPDHATFREKSVTTGLVGQALGIPLFDSM